ncbi:MAG: hypothetical protein HY049_17940 [Acidobacteria bacterium]|nr:hypothetical protein [Acidobacteriota bacterium]
MRHLAWISLVLLTAACVAPTSPLTEPVPPSAPSSPVVGVAGFELHDGFWMNLHHALFEQGLKKSRGAKTESLCGRPLISRELVAWDAAIEFYRANYATRDLLFDDALSSIKTALAAIDDGSVVTEPLPADLASILAAAAPIYRGCGWETQRAANERWISELKPKLERDGPSVEQRLSDVYRAPWPGRIRVDVVGYASWSGAYTTLHPVHSVISGSEPGQQGLTGFEIVFHEASHALIGPNDGMITKKLNEAFSARGAKVPRDLWHALLFYSTGEVVRDLFEREHLAPYTPMAFAGGLYDRDPKWKAFADAMAIHWKPYLDGKSDLDTAVRELAESL